jgi:hypothetical protein
MMVRQSVSTVFRAWDCLAVIWERGCDGFGRPLGTDSDSDERTKKLAWVSESFLEVTQRSSGELADLTYTEAPPRTIRMLTATAEPDSSEHTHSTSITNHHMKRHSRLLTSKPPPKADCGLPHGIVVSLSHAAARCRYPFRSGTMDVKWDVSHHLVGDSFSDGFFSIRVPRPVRAEPGCDLSDLVVVTKDYI